MLKRIKAAVVPVVLVAAVAGAAGYRAQDSGSGRRLDELSKERTVLSPQPAMLLT